MITKPLYGHTSVETSYLVDDYPFGFRLRCKIRYYIEYSPKKGYRLVSQTTNPKRGDIWNAPKKSTYSLFAACLYLDENNHVQWAGLNEYSDAPKFLEFFTNFPNLELTNEQRKFLSYAVISKLAVCKGLADGKAMFSINGVPQIPSEHQIEEAKKELEIWKKVKELLK